MNMRERVTLKMSQATLATVALLAASTAQGSAQRLTPPAPAVVDERPAPTQRVVRPEQVDEVPPVRPRQPRPADQGHLPVPDDVQRLLDRHRMRELAIRREAETQISEERRSLIRELQAMQDRYARSGALDEAIAIRDRIRTLQNEPGVQMLRPQALRGAEGRVFLTSERVAVASMSDRATATGLAALRGRAGDSVVVPVVGSTTGEVWGDRIYTDDSSIAAAAVHAGVVDPGEFAVVRLTLLGAQDRYDGRTRNGVTSESYGTWEGSFRVESAPGNVVVSLPEDESPQLWTIADLRGQDGRTLLVEVTGLDDGRNVWGSDIYTDDSSLAVAAVHAGVLRAGERGVVRVTILPGRESYEGSARNGVRSASYQRWPGSFRVERR